MLCSCRLSVVNLSGNKFIGPLDASWSKLVQLQRLDLSRNMLSGPLPSSWAGVRPAGTLGVTFNVSFNSAVNGSLPSAWGLAGPDAQYMRLDTLDATNCSLSGNSNPAIAFQSACCCAECFMSLQLHAGTLPIEWSNMQTPPATRLVFANNVLKGSIPTTWGNKKDPVSLMTGSGWRQIILTNNR
jgi:hypothetical protein